jgi:hypothetical protein
MRKLLMLAVAALAAVVLAGVSASSALAVSLEARDHVTSELCEELYVDEVVEGVPYYGELYSSGGCVVEGFDGQFNIVYNGAFVNYFDTTFVLVVGPDGTAYAVDQEIESGPYGLVRYPCDSSEGQKFAWPVEFSASGNGDFTADLKICVRGPSGPGIGSWTTVAMDVSHVGADGWTELVQSAPNASISGAYWSSANTVDLIEIEE